MKTDELTIDEALLIIFVGAGVLGFLCQIDFWFIMLIIALLIWIYGDVEPHNKTTDDEK